MQNIAFRLIYFSKLCSGNTVVSLKELKAIYFCVIQFVSIFLINLDLILCSRNCEVNVLQIEVSVITLSHALTISTVHQ